MFIDIATLIISAVALIAAICIPRRIMINQIYADLMADYRSPEMGGAVLSIIHFYKFECEGKLEKIEERYIDKYKTQIKEWNYQEIGNEDDI